MATNRTKPISRNNLFYSQEDFDLECEILEGYIEEDLGQSVVLYEIDRKRTNVSDIYQESKGKVRYKPPKEVPCMYQIQKSDTKAIDKNTATGVYAVSGNLTLYVMPITLKKYRCDIRRGDYIGVQVDQDRMAYFVVTDDGKVNYANENLVGAFKPAWRKCECAPATLAEFDAK